MANLMNTFQAKLMAEIVQHWQIPTTLSDAEIKQLAGQVVVYVRLSKSGHVVSRQFLRDSSNSQFNASIDRVIRRYMVSGGGKTLPVPQEVKVQGLVLREGLRLSRWDAFAER